MTRHDRHLTGRPKRSAFAREDGTPLPPPATAVERLVRRLDALINASGKTQREIAKEVGFPRPNVISMLKKGDMPLPRARVVPLARALDVEPADLLGLWYEAYEPDTLAELQEHPGAAFQRDRVLGQVTPPSSPHHSLA